MATTDFKRQTRQRQVILEELRKTSSHPTAAELHRRVKRHLPKISLGTVYRNLELLVDHGTVRKLDFSGVQARYDADIHEHDHIRCVVCGRVDDVTVEATKVKVAPVQRISGYSVMGHRLEYYGICKRCQSKQGRGSTT